MANVALPLAVPRSSERDLLLKVAHQRLYPRLTDPNFLVLRSRRLIFQKWIADIAGDQPSILDVGGRYQPYRPFFNGRDNRYVGYDILQTELVSVVGDGEWLPFAPESFDVVIATQVFEYFSQPQKAAEEIYATLKLGGCLLMSAVSAAPRFVDEERWRFTPKGIRTVLSSFSDVTIVPETSSFGGLLRTINLAVHSFSRYQILRELAEHTICPLLNLTGLALESLRFTANDQFTPNYSVLAIK